MEQREIDTPARRTHGVEGPRESPDFGGGVDYHDLGTPRRERLPEGARDSPPRNRQSYTPPEDQNPRGCSLHSMEPLREWFCRGADMTSASEFEAALCQLEDDPPDIREYNTNIREERWTHFSLEGAHFPALTVDVIQRGEALAVFERDLIIHFQQISRAAALYVRALLGGVKRALEVYRRVDDTTKNYPWATMTTEERWHSHAEGALMVALTSLKLPAEAWKSARILRAIPNCRLSGTKIASQNRSDHGGRKRARNHSAAEIAGFFASPAAKRSLAASDFGVNLKIAESSQRPWPQVAAAARFCGRSDHGTLRLSPGLDDVLSFLEPCAECGREWPNGISSESTGCRSICDAGDNRLTKLEVCRQKIGRDRRSSPYSDSAPPGLCENPFEASSRQQEGELCLSATIKYTSLDES